MKTVRVGGVPEHFNYAWYIGLKNNLFKENGINLRWVDCPGGTGQMTEALRTNSIDMAVVLTEGIVKAISEGLSCKIVQTYVQSPLVWGVHVAYNSKFKTSSELKKKQAAISRYGSGSHLMAYINAQQLEWDVTCDLKFKLVKNLDGGVKALSNGDADYFLWEKFTTKPFVDEGIFEENQNLNDLLSRIDSGEVQLITIEQLKAQFESDDEATEITSEIAVKGLSLIHI